MGEASAVPVCSNLNIQDPDQLFVRQTLNYMFDYACDNHPSFKLFFSLDMWAQKAGGDDVYFVPDFDGTLGYYEADPGWWEYWGPIVDGLFSWDSVWPN